MIYLRNNLVAIFTLVLMLFLVTFSVATAQDSGEEGLDATAFEGAVSTTSLDEALAAQGSSSPSSILNQRPPTIGTGVTETDPKEAVEKQAAIISLFEKRVVSEFSVFSFMAFWVQKAVSLGIPADTIVLILLAPIIATLVSFIRIVVGLPTLELLVPIALAFALVSVGIVLGLIILAAVYMASYVSKVILKDLRMMFFPKRSMSMLFLSFFVFAALTMAVFLDIEAAKKVSIFPVLIIMLLGEAIVSLQLHKSFMETFTITTMTIFIGLVGYLMATSVTTQLTLLVYPELVLLTIPANILIGRYFGLRVSEMFRFSALK